MKGRDNLRSNGGVVMFALSQLDMPGEKTYYELKRLLVRWMEAYEVASCFSYASGKWT
jgi:hypothetical protein